MKKIRETSVPKLGDVTFNNEFFIWLGMDNGVRTINCIHYMNWGHLFGDPKEDASANIVTWYGKVKVII